MNAEIQKRFPYMQNGPLAIGTTRGEELMVVFVTIWTPIPLKEACAAQLRFTHHAYKVLGVPHLTQCCDYLQNINYYYYHNNNNEWEEKVNGESVYHLTACM